MELKEKILVIKKYTVQLIVAFIIASLEILGEFLDVLRMRSEGATDVSLGIKQLMGFGIKAFLLWIVSFAILLLGWKYGKKAYRGVQSGCFIFKRKIYTWLVIIISWIPCFIAYFPGIYSYDGEPQLLQYTTGQFDNHHPVFHTLILGGCYDLGQWLNAKGICIDGIAFYSIIQAAILAFALTCVINYLTKQGAGRAIQWMALLLFCLFPATPVMAISTTKDTFFTAVFVMLLVRILEIRKNGNFGWKTSIEVVAYAVLCMLFRRNASYVFILMLLIMVMLKAAGCIKERKVTGKVLSKWVMICILSIVVFYVTESSIMKATNAVQGESAEALSVPLMQMARAYKSNQEEVTIKYGQELYNYISALGLNNYRPLISDGVKQGFNNELFGQDKINFATLYIKMFKDYPGSYVQAFLYMTKGDWQLMDNSHCEVYKNWWRDRCGYLITDATPVFALGFVNKSNLLPAVRDAYEAVVTDCCYRAFAPLQLIFSPALYVFIVVISGLVLVIQKKKDLLMIWLIVGLYLLTIVAGPCVLVRYIFPLMMLAPVMASIIWEE